MERLPHATEIRYILYRFAFGISSTLRALDDLWAVPPTLGFGAALRSEFFSERGVHRGFMQPTNFRKQFKALAQQLDATVETSARPEGTTVSITHATFSMKAIRAA